jgi:hypothetical protein
MGMFDSFHFEDLKCPKCSKPIEQTQTKQFSCCMLNWYLGDIFEEVGRIDGTTHITMGVDCDFECNWSSPLEVTITDNVITGYRGVGFDYNKSIDLKAHLINTLRERNRLRNEVWENKRTILELLTYIQEKEPDKKGICDEVIKDEEIKNLMSISKDESIMRLWHPVYCDLKHGKEKKENGSSE